MKIIIGCDAYGYNLKEAINQHLKSLHIAVQNIGVDSSTEQRPYYDIAAEAAQKIATNKDTKAILICGTGMGMAIIANKFPGVYAAVCENPQAAQYARSINNSNVLTLGAMITSAEMAIKIIDAWLTTEFTSGWEKPIKDFLNNSVDEIKSIENNIPHKKNLA